MLLKIIVSLTLCCCCWLSSLGSVSAMEITEQELNRLDSNLMKLEALNQKSRVELQTLKDQLQLSESQLTKLNEQLNQLQIQSTKQEDLLKIANESLKTYEKEMARTETQRNFILAILAILLIRS